MWLMLVNVTHRLIRCTARAAPGELDDSADAPLGQRGGSARRCGTAEERGGIDGHLAGFPVPQRCAQPGACAPVSGRFHLVAGRAFPGPAGAARRHRYGLPCAVPARPGAAGAKLDANRVPNSMHTASGTDGLLAGQASSRPCGLTAGRASPKWANLDARSGPDSLQGCLRTAGRSAAWGQLTCEFTAVVNLHDSWPFCKVVDPWRTKAI